MLEKWKVIEEDNVLKNTYLISNKGRIKMRTRSYYCGRPRVKRIVKGGIMKPSITAKKYTKQGYYAQPLRCVDGSQRTFFVHRLVAKYFLSDWNPDLTVNHKDENGLNNDVRNLEMMSMIENNRYGTRAKRSIEKRKRNGKMRQIIPVSAFKDGEIRKYRSMTACSQDLGIGIAKVRSCLRGERKTAKGWTITEQSTA